MYFCTFASLTIGGDCGKSPLPLAAFLDLEKAYDRIPRELVYWCMRKTGIPEKLVRIVNATS